MNKKTSALLLSSNNCPHCHALKRSLDSLLKKEKLSMLEVINIEEQPERAKEYNIRSVPWLKLGLFEFNEGLTESELANWITWADSNDANSRYIEYLLLNGKLSLAIDWLEKTNVSLNEVLILIANFEVKINVRIGVGAIFEHFEGSHKLIAIIPSIKNLMDGGNAELRADLCHFLLLSRDKSVCDCLKKRLNDEDGNVREIAQESIDELCG